MACHITSNAEHITLRKNVIITFFVLILISDTLEITSNNTLIRLFLTWHLLAFSFQFVMLSLAQHSLMMLNHDDDDDDFDDVGAQR